MRVAAILNRNGGTLKTTDVGAFSDRLAELFEGAGHDFTCHAIQSDELSATLQQIAETPEIDAIVAGGGDGTVSAAAAMCWKAGKTLGVLPAGTMNLFARSLGIPLDINEAAEALATGKTSASDIATANGRAFVHQYSVGLHPSMVRARNAYTYRSRIGKMLASVRAALDTLPRRKTFDTEITADGQGRQERLSVLAISNNPFGEGHLPYADRLDSGTLGVYTAGKLGPRQALQLASDLVLGSWSENSDLVCQAHRQVSVRFSRYSPSAKCLIDGELLPLAPEVTVEIHPKALRVLVPTRQAEDGRNGGR